MTSVSDENGIINNFAKEPAMYYAEEPSQKEKQGFMLWGAIAMIVVGASVVTAVVVS